MTEAVLAPAPTTTTTAQRSRLGWVIADSLAVAGRNLQAMRRLPQVVVFSTIQPIIFVLMFRYVFGGAIEVPGLRYVDFLMGGIFVQTVTFGSVNTGIALADDLQKGLIERFRSLPMSRSAVLAGRTIADLVRNVLVVALMVATGFLVGFRLHTNVFGLIAAIALLLAFGFAMSWIMAAIGLAMRNAEAVQAAAFPMMALLVFASNAFVPVETMPRWLEIYATHQPVSRMVAAVRALTLGGPTFDHVVLAAAWCVGIVAVFAPLAVRHYRRASS